MGCASSTQSSAVVDSKQKPNGNYPVYGNANIMTRRSHGTSNTPVQKDLRWGCDFQTADRICNYNRHFAEPSGYLRGKNRFLQECESAKRKKTTVKFYDSNTGNLLFEAPKNRSMDDFLRESKQHGWPSFRDSEVNWEHVRCLRGGEAVSLAGTHLGHNLPDHQGNRYCINLVSVAGRSRGNEEEEPKESANVDAGN